MFGVLNLLLFYPSGAMYPIAAFPPWLRAIAVVDPFTYCVHGFKAILLKDGGFVAIQYDLLFLFVFGIGTLLSRHAALQANVVTGRTSRTRKRFPAGNARSSGMQRGGPFLVGGWAALLRSGTHNTSSHCVRARLSSWRKCRIRVRRL